MPMSLEPGATLRYRASDLSSLFQSLRNVSAVAVVVALFDFRAASEKVVERGDGNLIVVNDAGIQTATPTSVPISAEPAMPSVGRSILPASVPTLSAPALTTASTDSDATSSRLASARRRPTGTSAVTASISACSSTTAEPDVKRCLHVFAQPVARRHDDPDPLPGSPLLSRCSRNRIELSGIRLIGRRFRCAGGTVARRRRASRPVREG